LTQERIAKFLDSTGVTIFVSIVTLWALFGDDIRILAVSKRLDPIFYISTLLCFFIFTVEILLSCYAKAEYLFSFFFWLDILSTVTLLLDVGWISDLIFGQESDASSGNSAAQVAKAARASRIGTRAARIIRIIRLIRLIRIVKLYKAAEKERSKKLEEEKNKKKGLRGQGATNAQIGTAISPFPHANSNPVLHAVSLERRGVNDSDDNIPKRKNSDQDSSLEVSKRVQSKNSVMPLSNNSRQPMTTPPGSEILPAHSNTGSKEVGKADTGADEEIELLEEVKESNVGKELISNITKTVIGLILVIMISIPLFNSDTYLDDNYTGQTSALMQMQRISTKDSSPLFLYTFDALYNHFQDQTIPIIYMNVSKSQDQDPTNTVHTVASRGDYALKESLRSDELILQANPTLQLNVTGVTWVYSIQLYFNNRGGAVLGAWLGILRTIFVCVILTVSALRLSKNSETLVINPLEKMVFNIRKISKNPLEASELEEKEIDRLELLERTDPSSYQELREQMNYEPAVLEKTIIKIGTLLAIGFGEAGSDIIALNMKKSGTVDPMMEGVKIVAIFGFCDIRSFSDVTEVLKKNVMIFVNEVADIVHNNVDEHQGAANKNIGEAFLLVWKIPQDHTMIGEDGQKKANPDSKRVKALADLSVIAFIKVLAGINKSSKLRKYYENKELRVRFTHGYKVSMGFGLHIGWGVEGAIGSKFKIDASYLSPNVNMSARLEAASRQFGVSILVS